MLGERARRAARGEAPLGPRALGMRDLLSTIDWTGRRRVHRTGHGGRRPVLTPASSLDSRLPDLGSLAARPPRRRWAIPSQKGVTATMLTDSEFTATVVEKAKVARRVRRRGRRRRDSEGVAVAPHLSEDRHGPRGALAGRAGRGPAPRGRVARRRRLRRGDRGRAPCRPAGARLVRRQGHARQPHPHPDHQGALRMAGGDVLGQELPAALLHREHRDLPEGLGRDGRPRMHRQEQHGRHAGVRPSHPLAGAAAWTARRRPPAQSTTTPATAARSRAAGPAP